MPVDYVYRIDQPHVSGQLALICGVIAEGRGLIGDVDTITMGRERSIREINVEVVDHEQAKTLAGLIGQIEDVRLITYFDRALNRHTGGKLRIEGTMRMESFQDMRDVYTPGVARVCSAIADDPSLASRLTMIGRTVAICTNGTRVLGLGDIGPVASMPVMEGKALFYRQMAGISAMPILINADEPDAFIETVLRIAPGFGAIHLEDIRAPDCFEIERRLKEELDIPVMHDDVHGTAVACLAAVLVGCDRVELPLDKATVGQLGLGAAGFGIASLEVEAGAKRVIASDPNEAAHEQARSAGIEVADFETVMAEADIVVATTGKPGLIKPEMIREGQVIFALTNPEPEIHARDAEKAGAAFAGDGAAVNNVLGFPGIFRGALEVGAREISTQMKLAAARAIADETEASELVPDALDTKVHDRVAEAVAQAAQEEGLARPDRTPPLL